MNITIIAGGVIGIIVTILGIATNGSVLNFWDVGSMLIVLGGTCAVIIACFPKEKLALIPKLIKIACTKNSEIDEIAQMTELATIARRDGLLALEKRLPEISDPFLKNGIMLILDGNEPQTVQSMLETEAYFMDQRHTANIEMFETGAKAAPAFGMVGTLIGLINMLKGLTENMDEIGPAMSLALLTTLYGVLIANLVFSPLANQLANKNHQEQLRADIIIEGILSIQSGENPRVMEEKLRGFVSVKSIAGEAAHEE